jgi:hypothetical protein
MHEDPPPDRSSPRTKKADHWGDGENDYTFLVSHRTPTAMLTSVIVIVLLTALVAADSDLGNDRRN